MTRWQFRVEPPIQALGMHRVPRRWLAEGWH